MNATEDSLKEYFKNRSDIVLAFLFGSQSKGKTHRESDFDIAVWPKEKMSIDNFNKLWGELETLLHTNVDLISLPSARPTVTWSALRGKRLLIRDFKLFLSLFVNVSREAEDIQDFMIDYWRLKKRYAAA